MSDGFGCHPVSSVWQARSCAPSLCETVRTRVTLSITLAMLGISPQRLRPGTFVLICPSSLFIPAGASSFGSNVSYCDGPPSIQSRMTDLAFAPLAPSASAASMRNSSVSESESPRNPTVPTLIRLRRDIMFRWSAISKSGFGCSLMASFPLLVEQELLGVQKRPHGVFAGLSVVGRFGDVGQEFLGLGLRRVAAQRRQIHVADHQRVRGGLEERIGPVLGQQRRHLTVARRDF